MSKFKHALNNMKISTSDNSFQIDYDSQTMVVDSPGLGVYVATNFQGDDIKVKVKRSLLHFFTPTFIILKNDNPIGKITQGYFGGNFKIQFDAQGQTNQYHFKTGSKKFELLDASKLSLLVFKYDFSLSKFKSNYEVELQPAFHTKSHKMELALYSMFCIMYYMNKGGSTIAG